MDMVGVSRTHFLGVGNMKLTDLECTYSERKDMVHGGLGRVHDRQGERLQYIFVKTIRKRIGQSMEL